MERSARQDLNPLSRSGVILDSILEKLAFPGVTEAEIIGFAFFFGGGGRFLV